MKPYTYIPLSRGQRALVNCDDVDKLYPLKRWCANWMECDGYYAVRSYIKTDGTRTTQSMHRELMGLIPGDSSWIDHINHNTLDNRRKNLRICTPRQNAENRIKQSKYGIGVRKRCGRYRAVVKSNGHMYVTSTFGTPEEAQQARRVLVKKLDV